MIVSYSLGNSIFLFFFYYFFQNILHQTRDMTGCGVHKFCLASYCLESTKLKLVFLLKQISLIAKEVTLSVSEWAIHLSVRRSTGPKFESMNAAEEGKGETSHQDRFRPCSRESPSAKWWLLKMANNRTIILWRWVFGCSLRYFMGGLFGWRAPFDSCPWGHPMRIHEKTRMDLGLLFLPLISLLINANWSLYSHGPFNSLSSSVPLPPHTLPLTLRE